MKKILIIKHGSLGDIISATSAIYDIKNHYKGDKLSILTSKKFKNFFLDSKLFDSIIADNKNGIKGTFVLIKKILNNNFDLIIDLQNSQRTSFYIFLIRFFSKVEINGTTFFATKRYKNNHHSLSHVVEGLSNQIELLNINTSRKPHLEWFNDKPYDFSNINNDQFIIINPGCSKHSIQKRWPPENFAYVCSYLVSKKILPIVIGSKEDAEVIDAILKKEKNILNLIDKSPLSVIYQLSKKAIGAISNDTGPAHLIAATGCKIHLILSSFSNTNTVIPQSSNVSFTQKEKIDSISKEEIIKIIESLFKI